MVNFFLATGNVETREEFPYLPQHQPDDSLKSLPPDVLFLSKNHSIKGNNNWPRPSGTGVNRAIKDIPLRFCHDFDRVSTIYVTIYRFIYICIAISISIFVYHAYAGC